MVDVAAPSIDKHRPWPLTPEAWDDLNDEIGRLRKDLSSLSGQGLEEGIVQHAVAHAARRLQAFEDVLERCQIVDDKQRAAIGRRATLRDADGRAIAYRIAFPGSGDPSNGSISADTPLGVATLGARIGDVVEVRAPGGRWSLTVLAID